jgi:hypothetical protein
LRGCSSLALIPALGQEYWLRETGLFVAISWRKQVEIGLKAAFFEGVCLPL